MIQYLHVRNYTDSVVDPTGGKTVALEVPTSETLDSLEIGDVLTLGFGEARCSQEDNYCKKVGRVLATSRLKHQVMTIVRRYNDGDDNVFVQLPDMRIVKLCKHRGSERYYFEVLYNSIDSVSTTKERNSLFKDFLFFTLGSTLAIVLILKLKELLPY